MVGREIVCKLSCVRLNYVQIDLCEVASCSEVEAFAVMVLAILGPLSRQSADFSVSMTLPCSVNRGTTFLQNWRKIILFTLLEVHSLGQI